MKIINCKSKAGISILIAIFIIIITCFVGTIGVSATGFSGGGKGTVKNPYLVSNSAQLEEIRNNLSANYKLANNIDMSGVANFVPIGTIKDPFTGTFTCDTSSDGSAKYIIKNLKINLKPVGATLAEKYSGYKEDLSMHWQAALFGSTSKATFTNIVILNALVTSTVEGRSSMNSDWSTNKGTSFQQSTGVLIGSGLDTTVTGCGASGSVSTASNNVGGLIGTMSVSDGKTITIKNSYSLVNVKTTGVWNSGGFIGGQESFWGKYNGKLNIESCYYKGSFTGSETNAGAFCAAVKGTVKNCRADGTVETSSSGCFYATDVLASGITKNIEQCENCLTTAVITGRTKSQTNKKVTKNNWITDAVGGLEIGFAAGSIEQVNAAFKSNPAWMVKAGTYPQLKNIHMITNPDSYKPISVTSASSSSANQSKVENASNAENASKADNASQADTAKDNTTITNDNNANTSEIGGNGEAGGVSTIVEQSTAKISLAEKILFIILAVIIILLIASTVVVITKWVLLMKSISNPKLTSKE